MKVCSESRASHWNGGKSFTIVQRIVSGPVSMIGRDVSMSISFDQIERLIEQYQEAKNRLKITEEAVERINRANQENDQ
jgi:hypothetical protein